MKCLLLPLLLLLVSTVNAQPKPADYRAVFQQDSAMRKWSRSIPGFSTDAFVLERVSDFENHSPDTLRGKEAGTYFNTYLPLISFSPDKKQWIDFYSYQVSLEKVGKARYRAYIDADQAVDLGDKTTGISTGIVYMGASSWTEEAVWLDNHLFLFSGVHSVDKGFHPFIYIGDTRTRKLYYYSPAGDSLNRTRKYVSWQWAKQKTAGRIIEE
ncbi:hypothetical protein [Chitinophaga qingshengii]|uniref:Uncharacterized protein n=1 Tax=Chitinophaga qingshengii TaxID=1569794 RepID=A0ABR7TR69_9BACT|nr:hypothetical protein [Chitinophaga qingshengii]MBC9932989.1 hypothetical protein [Chitinophaga qingshengii]